MNIRRFAHKECVEDAAQRPDVHLVAVALLAEHLRGDVVGGPAQGLLPLPVIVHLGGQTEVSDLALHVVVEEDVAQLEVSVDDLVLVEVENSKENVSHEVSSLRLGDCLPSLVKLHQTSFSADFQDDVDKITIFEVGVEFHQVGVGDGFVQPEHKKTLKMKKNLDISNCWLLT